LIPEVGVKKSIALLSFSHAFPSECNYIKKGFFGKKATKIPWQSTVFFAKINAYLSKFDLLGKKKKKF
jgi:hypothetical protein